MYDIIHCFDIIYDHLACAKAFNVDISEMLEISPLRHFVPLSHPWQVFYVDILNSIITFCIRIFNTIYSLNLNIYKFNLLNTILKNGYYERV